MKFKNIFIILSIFTIISLTGCSKDSNKSNPEALQNNEVKEENIAKENIIENKEENIQTDETTTKEKPSETTSKEQVNETTTKEQVSDTITKEENTNIEDKNEDINNLNNNENINTYSENDKMVISAFENINTKANTLESNNGLDKAKGIFITIVDFIFYDSEINGVKFDDLTEAGKQKILELAASIDSKIESKFPNYKNTISTKAKNAFNKASELIKQGANNIGAFAKEKLGEENYNNLIDAKDDLIKYTKNAIDIVGNFSSNLYNSTKEKLKNWYKKFKEN